MISNDVSERTDPKRDSTIAAWLILGLCLAMPVAAIWTVDGFVTQDGPAHLYNADILVQSLKPASPFRDVFAVRWQPLPNWAGHLTAAALVATLPPRVADRVMITLTLVALPISLFWLRGRIAGGRGLLLAAPLVVTLGLNVTWLLGFNAFLLGASLFPVTLGVWWAGREEGLSYRRAFIFAALVVFGYFCHLVSLGLTIFGLVALELFTPGAKRKGRWITTGLGLIPILVLFPAYLRLMKKGGGGLDLQWKHLTNIGSPRSWINQMTWVDPISLARKDYAPLLSSISTWHNALAPVVWVGAGLFLIITPTVWKSVENRPWWFVGFALLVGGLLGPDTFGPSHGEYLQQRIVLLGLTALVPVLPLDRGGWRGTGATVAILGAFALQTLIVWDYARWSDRTAGAILKAGDDLGRRQCVATLLIDIRSPFRSNPLLHADCALGVGTGNIIWANYETRYYYFPVQFRDGFRHPDSLAFEKVALSNDPIVRRRLWNDLIKSHGDRFDRVIVWGSEPGIDAELAEAFMIVHERSGVRILRPKDK